MSAVNFLWNPLNDNIVEEFDDAGATIAEYTTEPREFGNIVSQYRDGQESFFHFDGVGSTLALTNSASTVTDAQSYSAFGETTDESGGTDFPFQFVGQREYYRDRELGEYAIRRRDLNVRDARWLSLDQLSSSVLTEYEYALNNPLRFIDPSGDICLPPGSGWLTLCTGTCKEMKLGTAALSAHCAAWCLAASIAKIPGCTALSDICLARKGKSGYQMCLTLYNLVCIGKF